MKQISLETKIKKILMNTLLPMTVLMVVLLIIVSQYVSKYDRLSENLAVSSEFNLHFKDDIDLEMYYIAIGSKDNSYLQSFRQTLLTEKAVKISSTWRHIWKILQTG